MVRVNADILISNVIKTLIFKTSARLEVLRLKPAQCSTSAFLKFKLITAKFPESVPVVRWNKERGPANSNVPL